MIVAASMMSSESKLVTLYQQHSIFLEESTKLESQEEQKQALAEFSEKVKLSSGQEALMKFAQKGQKIIEKLTPGAEHCVLTKEYCKVYKPDVIIAAQGRQAKIRMITGEISEAPFINGTPYTFLDYILKIAFLFIEALVISWIVILGYQYLK